VSKPAITPSRVKGICSCSDGTWIPEIELAMSLVNMNIIVSQLNGGEQRKQQ
jgi:hypothetical protein